MRHLFSFFLATFFLFVGVLGLLLPVIPGFLFLVLAAGLYASIFPPVRNMLGRSHPRMRRFFRRLDHGRQLDFISHCKLAFWASVEAVSPRHKPTAR